MHGFDIVRTTIWYHSDDWYQFDFQTSNTDSGVRGTPAHLLSSSHQNTVLAPPSRIRKHYL